MENELLPPTTPSPKGLPEIPAPIQTEPSVLSQDRQQASQPVFVVEDSFYRSRTPPRPAHWSIAWSDLMMTMFILFLTLFAHQRSHQEILAHGHPNKIADETIPVQVDKETSALVFHPISQDVSLKTSGQLQEISLPHREQTGADILIRHQAMEKQPPSTAPSSEPLPSSPVPEALEEQRAPASGPSPPPPEETHQHQEATPQQPAEKEREELITGIYDLSKVTLASEKLNRFASVELVPDKTMRIILTGDLLFPSGQAELTSDALDSLKKLAKIIKKTPYMINVIGHTDSKPVRSLQYPSNWELSLARASRVARFLINETQLAPRQFSVAGYSSFRPLKPNTTEENRRVNRRVEIILSKELPQAEAPSPVNLQ